MKYSLLLFLLSFPILALCQNTSIPDPFFEQILIDAGYDSGTPDGVVLTANISTITYLNFNNGNINPGDVTDLTGIEDFTALKELNCSFNNIQVIDLSNNIELTHLNCSFNFVSELDVSANEKLRVINCYGNNIEQLDLTNTFLLDTLIGGINKLSELDLSNNDKLTYLWLTGQYGIQEFTALDLSNNLELEFLHCGSLDITSLDLSAHLLLTSLDCFSNNLQSLNVKNGANQNFTSFNVGDNPSLTCITVDDPVWAEQNWTIINGNINEGMFFSDDCSLVMSEDQFQLNVKVYPTPTFDYITIEVPILHAAAFDIFDMMGRKVYTQKIDKEKVIVDLQSFSAGTYYLKVKNNNNSIIASKLMVKLQ